MGTRHLIAIVVDGEYAVAQYGQWDGYPSGQGSEIETAMVDLGIAGPNTDPRQVARFIDQARKVQVLSEVEAKDRWAHGNHLSRGFGSKVIEYVMLAEQPETFRNLEFAADSLFCEWAYVVDLDNLKLEVFKGFNKQPVGEDERFAFLQKEGGDRGYYPVRLLGRLAFADLDGTKVEKFEGGDA